MDNASVKQPLLASKVSLTVSVHRVKDPARALGYIGAKGYSRGSRTIAGTLVLTPSTQDVLYEFLSASGQTDVSKDSKYVKVDQIPPFNISILMCNELGYASYRPLLGVELVTDGTVYSINDAFTEQTISYVCADFTPLLPLDVSSLFGASPKSQANPYESRFYHVSSSAGRCRICNRVPREDPS